LCARTSTLSPAESQNCVPVMSTTTVVCPRVAHPASIARSCPAVVTSISAGAVTTGTPPAIWMERLPSGTCATSRPGHNCCPATG